MNSPDDQLIQAAIQAGEAQIPELVKFFAHILEQDPDHFAALHARNILCLRSGNIDASAESLREVLTRLPCHHSYVEAYLQKVSEYFESSDNLVKFPTLIKTYLEKFPNEPHGHLMEVMLYYTSYDPQQLRNSLTRCYQNVKLGIHFQPSLVASIFDAAMGANWTSVTPPNLPTRIFEEISKIPIASDCAASLQEAPPPKGVSPTEELNLSTSQGEPIGVNGAAVNGLILGATTPTKYFFQYGISPGAMNHRTEIRQVPPGRFGRTRETGSNIFRRINSFSLSASFLEPGGQSSLDGASMKLEGPFGKDRDHLDGIGVIDLLMGWESAAHLRGQVPSSFNSKTYPKPTYPGEAIDLRDAEFTVTYRAKGFDTKDFHPVAWIHGGSGEAFYPEVSENYSAWAYTANLGNWRFNNDGAWHKSSFSFKCDSKSWSFCGSNIEEMDQSMERICYHPIADVLRENRFGDICICFVCGDQLVPPEGDLEIGALELSYRSYSLLAPDQGTILVSHPLNGLSDPSVLTGGWIGTFEECWRSEENPKESQEFIWQFRDNASIRSIRLHNNPLSPSKDVELMISNDGKTFEPAWSGTFENVPLDPVEWPNEKGDGASFNFAKVAVFDEPLNARFLKLEIKSGYRPAYWGLDAIEVFGDTPDFIPSPEPFTVSEEIIELEPGPLFVQLIAENETGRTEGEIIEVTRPGTSVPLVSDPILISLSNNIASVRFRTNAMGTWGELSGEIQDANGHIITSTSVSIGKQELSRESVLHFGGLKPSGTYEGFATASNEHGKSDLCKFIFSADDV